MVLLVDKNAFRIRLLIHGLKHRLEQVMRDVLNV